MSLSIRKAVLPDDVDALRELGERIYAGDPAWVEPLRANRFCFSKFSASIQLDCFGERHAAAGAGRPA